MLGKVEIEHKFDEGFKTWLPNNPSRALLVCLGAGPWKEQRRYNVQKEVLAWFDEAFVDLCQIDPDYVADTCPFPLTWQTLHLRNIVVSLWKKKSIFWMMTEEMKVFADWKLSTGHLFDMARVSPNGTKTLWLFVRDYLNLPAFPIDRWVKKWIDKRALTANPWTMVDICLTHNVNPSALNRSIFFEKGSNHDWSG